MKTGNDSLRKHNQRHIWELKGEAINQIVPCVSCLHHSGEWAVSIFMVPPSNSEKSLKLGVLFFQSLKLGVQFVIIPFIHGKLGR